METAVFRRAARNNKQNRVKWKLQEIQLRKKEQYTTLRPVKTSNYSFLLYNYNKTIKFLGPSQLHILVLGSLNGLTTAPREKASSAQDIVFSINYIPSPKFII
jgi:hypothetical protein